MRGGIYSITFARYCTRLRTPTRGKRFNFDYFIRVCEEHSYEALVDVINEVREALEDFDLNWVTYE